MADETILTPGSLQDEEQQLDTNDVQYLEKDNYLGEYSTETDKQTVRNNLWVYSRDDTYKKTEVYTKTETDVEIANSIRNNVTPHINNTDDPHQTIPQVIQYLNQYVKLDGTTPFTKALYGVYPTQDALLATLECVNDVMLNHLDADDPHGTKRVIEDKLANYALLSNVYPRSQTYSKAELDPKLAKVVKDDGSTPFVNAQGGVDPSEDYHLSTKRYVDAELLKHIIAVDPHGFISVLNQRLSSYYKKSETYHKEQTYSRAQVDEIVLSLVDAAADSAIQRHVNKDDPHHIMRKVYNECYVKQDGTIPFTGRLKGIDAVDDADLVTYKQLKDVESKVDDIKWVTSGPVGTTVGFVEVGTLLDDEVSFLGIMDAIFYGTKIKITAPEVTQVNQKVDVTMSIHGSIISLSYVELWLNDERIGVFGKEYFTSGSYTVQSKEVTSDTTFKMKVYYTTGLVLEASCVTKIAFCVFVGLLPLWKTAYTITYAYLQELALTDPVNNKFYVTSSESLSEIVLEYNFSGTQFQHIFVVLPKTYPSLTEMSTASQKFSIDAFDVISDIPLEIPGITGTVVHKIYTYKQVILQLSSQVKFKFS